MSKRLFSLVLIVIMLSMGGCDNRTTISKHNVVTQITTTRNDHGSLTRRIYTDQDKMRQILNGLRSLGQKSAPMIDPGTLLNETYCITLTNSDGSQQIYCTKPDRYFREGIGPWRQVNPERIEELTRLLLTLPSDVMNLEERRELPYPRSLPVMYKKRAAAAARFYFT